MLMANDPDYSFDILRPATPLKPVRHGTPPCVPPLPTKRKSDSALMRRSAKTGSRLPCRRALSSGDRGSLAQCGAVANHARFLRRPAILRQTESPAYVSRSARILKADGTTPCSDGRHSDGNAEGARKAMMAHLSFVHTTIKRFDEDQPAARITRLPGDHNEMTRRINHDYFSSQRLSRRSSAHVASFPLPLHRRRRVCGIYPAPKCGRPVASRLRQRVLKICPI